MRLDIYLVEHQFVQTRSQATDLIKRGCVLINEDVIIKPGYDVKTTDFIKIEENSRFVSRAGHKLYQAILDFDITFHDKIVIDIGASTGGFTDCALQHGAAKIYTYDVGTDQMDTSLLNHPKVSVFESTNVLDVDLPHADVIMIDVSFTSIKPIFKHLVGFKGEIVALIKPQYEAGHIKFKQGVLKDLKKHKEILTDVLTFVRSLNFSIDGLKRSALKGKTGNQEYVLYIKEKTNIEDLKKLVGDLYA